MKTNFIIIFIIILSGIIIIKCIKNIHKNKNLNNDNDNYHDEDEYI